MRNKCDVDGLVGRGPEAVRAMSDHMHCASLWRLAVAAGFECARAGSPEDKARWAEATARVCDDLAESMDRQGFDMIAEWWRTAAGRYRELAGVAS